MNNSVEFDAVLTLEDGSKFHGTGFGKPSTVIGEVVFTTGMVGYTESLTDPSFGGQLLSFTYPLIGNYGVPDYTNCDEYSLPAHFESSKIQPNGVIVNELCTTPNHWSSTKTFDEWLKSEEITGISNIDTRSLTLKIRESGVMMGAISYEPNNPSNPDSILSNAKSYETFEFFKNVSTPSAQTYGNSDDKIVILDFGVKNGIIRNVLKRNYSAIVVPYNYTLDQIMEYNPKGVIVSNGPGDPQRCTDYLDTIKQICNSPIPTLGICLGHQLISLSLGASTYKLQYGHRGQNKSCHDLVSDRSYVTSQNHGYAVDLDSLSNTKLKPWFVNLDDNSLEGVRHENNSCIAVQFHPEAHPGPYDTSYVFDEFFNMITGDSN